MKKAQKNILVGSVFIIFVLGGIFTIFFFNSKFKLNLFNIKSGSCKAESLMSFDLIKDQDDTIDLLCLNLKNHANPNVFYCYNTLLEGFTEITSELLINAENSPNIINIYRIDEKSCDFSTVVNNEINDQDFIEILESETIENYIIGSDNNSQKYLNLHTYIAVKVTLLKYYQINKEVSKYDNTIDELKEVLNVDDFTEDYYVYYFPARKIDIDYLQKDFQTISNVINENSMVLFDYIYNDTLYIKEDLSSKKNTRGLYEDINEYVFEEAKKLNIALSFAKGNEKISIDKYHFLNNFKESLLAEEIPKEKLNFLINYLPKPDNVLLNEIFDVSEDRKVIKKELSKLLYYLCTYSQCSGIEIVNLLDEYYE